MSGTWFATPTLRFSIEVPERWPVDVDAVFRDLMVDGGTAARVDDQRPVRRYRVDECDPPAKDRGTLSIDGVPVVGAECKLTRNIIQRIIADLGNQLVDATDGLVMHAVTIERDGAAVMLTAPSAHGKSTASGHLMRNGFGLVAEDISHVDRDNLSVAAYHRPLGLSEHSLDLLDIAIPPGTGARCGCGGKLLIPAGAVTTLASARRPAMIAVVDRRSDTVEALTPAAALHRILELGVAPYPDSERDLDTLARLLAGARCVALGTLDLEAARAAVDDALRRPAPDPTPTLVETIGAQHTIYLGTEAVVLDGDRTHLLNATAAAVLLLARDRLTPAAIAAELAIPDDEVAAAMALLRESDIAIDL